MMSKNRMSIFKTAVTHSSVYFRREASLRIVLSLKLLILLFMTVGMHRAISANAVWNVTGGGSWNAASNWSPATVPATGSDVIFSSATAGGGAKATTLDKAFSINSLTFNATQTGAVSISTNTLTLNPGANNATTISVDTASGDHSISSSIILAGVANQAFGIGANRLFTISGNISGSTAARAITKSGAGILALSGANTFAGGTTLSAGTIAIGSSGVVASGGTRTSGPVGVGTLTIGDGTTFAANSTTARAIQNSLSLSGSITLGDATNTGALTFSSTDGTNTLTTAATATLTAATTLTLNSAVTINDVISGAAINLEKTGLGSLSLGAANTFSGTFTASGGTTNLTVNNALGSVTAVSVSTGARLQSSTSGFTNVINDAAAVTVNGTLDLSGGSETIGSLAGTSTTGSVVIGTFNSAAGSLTVGGDGTSSVFAGVISGAPLIAGTTILTKQGAGTLTLTNANTYTGNTSITAGKLLAANTTGSATGTGAVNIGTAGTLASGAGSTGIITGLVTTAGTGSTIAPGATAAANTGTVGTLTLSGGLNLAAGATIPFDLADTSANSDLIRITAGTFTGGTANGSITFNFNNLGVIDGTTYALINYAGATASGVDLSDFAATGVGGTFSFNGNELDYTVAVPEPATVFGGLLLVGALGWHQRRRLGGLHRVLRQASAV